jgi:hypothetical protein
MPEEIVPRTQLRTVWDAFLAPNPAQDQGIVQTFVIWLLMGLAASMIQGILSSQ